MQEIPGNDLFKDVAHYFLRTPHGDIEMKTDRQNAPCTVVGVDLTFPSGLCTINEDGSCSVEFKE